jgi:vancomycin resistance protein VanJ
MPKTEPPANPAFWRCSKCNTPNPWASYLTACMGCGTPRHIAASASRFAHSGEARPAATRPRSRVLPALVAIYGMVLIAVYSLMRIIGDAWWPGALLMLSPRAIFLVPIVPLAIWAFRARRRVIGGALVLEALFVAGPLMGFVIPLGRETPAPGVPTIRIMTFNRSDLPLDAESLMRYLERQRIDVVCFQETSGEANRLDDRLTEAGWHANRTRSVVSRWPVVGEPPRAPEFNRDQRRYTARFYQARIRGPEGREFVVGSLHMPTLRPGMAALLQGDFAACRALLDWWDGEIERIFAFAIDYHGPPTLIGGDFNQGPESSRLRAIRASGLWRSAFDEAGWGWGYTRPAALPWTRIDHVMVGVDWTIVGSWAGPSFGSDHRSLIAEVAFAPDPPARP